ncbi:MAG: UbiA family prenyltransferase [Planctomycetaceae bacterium]|nr:UbiA family prenyltransferase [Planctomycetaceae bacterium]MBT7728273.1 UbiA family prenyltransferase [Planctomycetaceae bacterium]
MTATLRTYLELVRFSHTIFALPFAIMAGMIAARVELADNPYVSTLHWVKISAGIIACMATARTAAMGFNRLVDRHIDARNPRTANRHLPKGLLSVGEVQKLVCSSSFLFVISTFLFLPNWLPLVLSLPVLVWLLGYSYAKRFTSLAHIWLGIALGLTPLAAWIAVRGPAVLSDPADMLPALVLAIAVTTWVAGFDTIYACQDASFDNTEQLQSLPSRCGIQNALYLAGFFHFLTILFLLALPRTTPFIGNCTSWAIYGIAGLLVVEHLLISSRDLSRVNQAFFTVNAAIGLMLLSGISMDLWFG